MPNFIEIIQLYLIPFAIAIPIVLLIVFFTTRRSEAPQIPDIDTQFPASAVNAFNSAKAINTERVYIGDHPDREGPSTVPGALRSAPAGPISLLVVDDSAVPRAKLRKLFESNDD